MLKRSLIVIAIVGLFVLPGCLTKPIATLETAATELIHPDGPVQTFFAYGPWSDEFHQSWDHFDAMRRTYLNDLNSIVDDYDKHFLRYDKYDPFAE